MGGNCSTELGESSLAQEVRESCDVLVHRLRADDPDLIEVSVPGYGVTDTELEEASAALASTTRLRSIDLGYNGIGPRGVAHLCTALKKSACGTETLMELRLSGNPIGREGCQSICEWLDSCTDTCGLKSLYLYQCDLDDECALLLANTLLRQKSITALNLDMNKFTKKTAIMMKQALQHNRTLAQLSFDSPSNTGPFPRELMDDIDKSLERNEELVLKREYIEEVKRKKAQRRAEREEEERYQRDSALADERRRVEEELAALEELKRQEDEQVRLLEAKMAETVSKRQAKAAESQAARQASLDKAISQAYEWRGKVTGHGTLVKEWRSGFTIMRTNPGEVGGAPTVSADAPRRLKALFGTADDPMAPHGGLLHYNCKWEDFKADEEGGKTRRDNPSGAYQGCKGTGHVCATVGYSTKPRPDRSAAHFFASSHPGAAKTNPDATA